MARLLHRAQLRGRAVLPLHDPEFDRGARPDHREASGAPPSAVSMAERARAGAQPQSVDQPTVHHETTDVDIQRASSASPSGKLAIVLIVLRLPSVVGDIFRIDFPAARAAREYPVGVSIRFRHRARDSFTCRSRASRPDPQRGSAAASGRTKGRGVSTAHAVESSHHAAVARIPIAEAMKTGGAAGSAGAPGGGSAGAEL